MFRCSQNEMTILRFCSSRIVMLKASRHNHNTDDKKTMFELNEGIYKFYVYILTNKSRIVLYTGVIGNLHQRLFQHVHKVNPDSFTSRV
ncbi:hypothetical protein SAMN05444408_102150 [Chryseobacterium takakiae]|uniref:GIY-YIG domain-containing protein n=1 Tax=Chryseobacterium takakiae TaxID=1302685 RepID=A0A1M4UK43_9FLAO|nr:hypothetical protein SAMN05444408_102150 [Chryseobacterium takakiae]